MPNRNSRTRTVPVSIGLCVGGFSGATVGYALWFGYNVIYGPWFPQAGVDPQPAGWVGWWIAAGTVAGASAGLMTTIFLMSLGRSPDSNDHRPLQSPPGQ
jgi:hypothetical protein